MQLIESILADAAAITTLRRDIHAHPELCFQEMRTADVIANALTDWWLSESRPVAERAQTLDRASRLYSFGPEWTSLRTLPWSAAFTSSIDGVIRRLLECDGKRQVHQWFAPAARPSEQTLSLFRLFGSVERDSGPELPPGTTDALRARRSGASDMLRTLGEVIGPKRLFVIEGW